jgi:hypothetical protein
MICFKSQIFINTLKTSKNTKTKFNRKCLTIPISRKNNCSQMMKVQTTIFILKTAVLIWINLMKTANLSKRFKKRSSNLRLVSKNKEQAPIIHPSISGMRSIVL